jgi:hypothetical protein
VFCQVCQIWIVAVLCQPFDCCCVTLVRERVCVLLCCPDVCVSVGGSSTCTQMAVTRLQRSSFSLAGPLDVAGTNVYTHTRTRYSYFYSYAHTTKDKLNIYILLRIHSKQQQKEQEQQSYSTTSTKNTATTSILHTSANRQSYKITHPTTSPSSNNTITSTHYHIYAGNTYAT